MSDTITISQDAGRRIYAIIEGCEDLIYQTRHGNSIDIEGAARGMERLITEVDDILLPLVNLQDEGLDDSIETAQEIAREARDLLNRPGLSMEQMMHIGRAIDKAIQGLDER